MNIIFGSASGIGNSLYQTYKSNKQDVYGIDALESEATDFVFNLENVENINEIVKQINDFKIQSITFCVANQNQNDNVSSIFNANVLSFLEFLNAVNSKLNNCVISAISSIHAVSSNPNNLYYASSKAALESGIKNFSIRKSSNAFYVVRLGATDTKKLRQNVGSIDSINSILPGGKIFDKVEVSNFIYTLNSNFKNLLNGAIIQIDNGVLSMLKTD